jgi:NADPH:quinone reductase-like Zn-dependent oxidoreductase
LRTHRRLAISGARRALGSDIAGVVDAVGDGVTRFRAWEEVYGDNLLMGADQRAP